MKKFAVLAVCGLLLLTSIQSCAEDPRWENRKEEKVLKADGFWDKVKKFFKKTFKLEVAFGHNIPNPNGGVYECVFRSLCYIKGEGELGANTGGITVVTTLDQNGSLIMAFDKADLTNDDLNYHFAQGQFEITDPVIVPHAGIDNSAEDYQIAIGTYPVIYEDPEIIAVLF